MNSATQISKPAGHATERAKKLKGIEGVERLIRGSLSPITGDECQLFEGRIGSDGFPMIDYSDGSEERACDVAFCIHFAVLRPGEVYHRCGNPSCVNFRHLGLRIDPTIPEDFGAYEI